MMKSPLLTFLLFCLGAATLPAQSSFTIQRTLKWNAEPARHVLSSGDVLESWGFEGCSFSDEAPSVPVFSEKFPLSGASDLSVEVVAVQWEPFTGKIAAGDALPGGDLPVSTGVQRARSKYFGQVYFPAVRRSAGGYERIAAFTLNVRVLPKPPAGAQDRGGPFTFTSALSGGTAYKFGVENSGVYKLDYNFLKNELGISDLDNIDPRTIRLFGNGGAMLPEKNSDTRPDDLAENAIQVVGEGDGKFDASDYILFYAIGPRPWLYRTSANDPELTVRQNLYDYHAWYFIKTGDGNGLRVQEQASVSAAYTTEEFDDVQRIEDDKVNLLDFFVSATGSGKKWFGDYFLQTRQRDYTFAFPNLVTGSTGRLRAEFAGRCTTSTVLRLTVDGTTVTRNINGVKVSDNEASYAALGVVQTTFQPAAADQVSVRVEYPEVSQQSEGWLDYIEVNVRRRLAMSGQIMEFRDKQTLTQDAATFRLSGVSGTLTVWDVTNAQKPALQQKNQSGSSVEFGVNTKDVLHNFVAFYDNAAFPKPEKAAGKIAAQNLHGLENVHMAIVYHPEVEAQAVRLAEHRRSFSGLDVALVNVEQLYNEFSSGGKDPAAIRDFARMLLERNPDKFEWLLLFGDGSFDPRNITASDDNKDLVPVYETAESFDPIRAYPSDDFFGLLSPDEGGTITSGLLDIAVGRLTARNTDEAEAVVDKIMAYDKDPSTLGDWHLRNLFIGDDEDGNAHINQADDLATVAANTE